MRFEFSGKDKSLSSAIRIQTDEKYKRGFSTKKKTRQLHLRKNQNKVLTSDFNVDKAF
jgi:hypothetical protein